LPGRSRFSVTIMQHGLQLGNHVHGPQENKYGNNFRKRIPHFPHPAGTPDSLEEGKASKKK
jgi:hypothetical protein